MTPSELRNWFAAEHAGWNWDNRCAGAAYQTCVATGRAVQPYPTATAARNASLIGSRDVSKAPPGAFHFWEYWATLGGVYANYGHVACELGGGWALMSNPEAWDEQWGIALGVANVIEWTRRRSGIVTYLGWSTTYGANSVNISGGGAAGSENDMALDQDDKGYLGTEFNSIVKQITDAVTKAVGGVPAQVWAQPIQAQDANGRGVTKDGKPVSFRADGFAASSNAQIAALREVIATLAIGQGLDPAAIMKAAEDGARKALQGLTLKAS